MRDLLPHRDVLQGSEDQPGAVLPTRVKAVKAGSVGQAVMIHHGSLEAQNAPSNLVTHLHQQQLSRLEQIKAGGDSSNG